jgi:hypothetical protein
MGHVANRIEKTRAAPEHGVGARVLMRNWRGGAGG